MMLWEKGAAGGGLSAWAIITGRSLLEASSERVHGRKYKTWVSGACLRGLKFRRGFKRFPPLLKPDAGKGKQPKTKEGEGHRHARMI